jgi:hypothetical protein
MHARLAAMKGNQASANLNSHSETPGGISRWGEPEFILQVQRITKVDIAPSKMSFREIGFAKPWIA